MGSSLFLLALEFSSPLNKEVTKGVGETDPDRFYRWIGRFKLVKHVCVDHRTKKTLQYYRCSSPAALQVSFTGAVHHFLPKMMKLGAESDQGIKVVSIAELRAFGSAWVLAVVSNGNLTSAPKVRSVEL